MTTRAQFIELVRTRTQDAKPYIDDAWPGAPTPSTLDRDELIERLMLSYAYEISKYDERVAVEDFTAAVSPGSKIYRLGVGYNLVSWAPGFSTIKRVIYPYDSTDETPDDYDTTLYEIRKWLFTGTLSDALFFNDATPTSPEKVRVEYAILHDFSATLTMTDRYVDAYAYLIAGHYLEAMASECLQHIDGTNTADVEGRSAASEVKQIATNFIGQFYTTFGADPKKRLKAASIWVSWDMSANSPYLRYHK